jgi:hypothetical protein
MAVWCLAGLSPLIAEFSGAEGGWHLVGLSRRAAAAGAGGTEGAGGAWRGGARRGLQVDLMLLDETAVVWSDAALAQVCKRALGNP